VDRKRRLFKVLSTATVRQLSTATVRQLSTAVLDGRGLFDVTSHVISDVRVHFNIKDTDGLQVLPASDSMIWTQSKITEEFPHDLET